MAISVAELLEKSESLSHASSAVESVRLQRKRHLAQVAIIKQKQEYAALFKTIIMPRSPGEVGHQLTNQKAGTIEDVDGDTAVFRTMEECDSLLTFLRNRAAMQGRSVDQPAAVFRRGERICETGTKAPKHDATIIEELRMHNDALRTHILDLLRENDDLRMQLDSVQNVKTEQIHSKGTQENLQNVKGNPESPEGNLPVNLALLEEEIQNSVLMAESSESEKSEKYYPHPDRMDINNLPSLQLPPLEMPKFDFDSLNIGSSSTEET